MTSREDIKAVTLLSSIDFAGRSAGFFRPGVDDGDRGQKEPSQVSFEPTAKNKNFVQRAKLFLKEAFAHNRNSKHSAAADQACKFGQTQGSECLTTR